MATRPVPKWCCQMRLTITRANSGFSGDVTQFANAVRRPVETRPAGRGAIAIAVLRRAERGRDAGLRLRRPAGCAARAGGGDATAGFGSVSTNAASFSSGCGRSFSRSATVCFTRSRRAAYSGNRFARSSSLISTAFACVFSSACCCRRPLVLRRLHRLDHRVARRGFEILQPLAEELLAERFGERGQAVLRRLHLPVDQVVPALPCGEFGASCRSAITRSFGFVHVSGL